MPEDRSILSRPGPPPDAEVAYGAHPDQVIDCYLPRAGHAVAERPSVVFIHGGFWRPEYDRDHARNAAAALAQAGFPTALIEYRRIPGDPDAMVADVHMALGAVASGLTPLPEGPVMVVGHSAGGHLALVLAADPHASVAGCLALAPVGDLAAGQELALDDDAVTAFLGADARDRPDLDPARLPSPLRPTVIVHGIADSVVPIHLSRSLATANTLVALDDVGHFELIDPTSAAWPALLRQLLGITSAGSIE
ncbi:MAG: alpha/beta hydrolase [Candidatus Nanopelagicales bacterium]|nr:alpha/beta hydrolase [Candidatus Nanopelagicales bacterium]MCF8537279.1 alpha/beta hydrolase [Candidatus Nanopelagicales bacterium]